jgi:cytosine deaminase
VGLATNNVQNLFTPFGDGDVLKICTLLAQILQMGTAPSHELCLEMAPTKAARAIGINNYGISPRKVADLVILEARSATEAIAAAPVGRTVIKQGCIVSRSQRVQQFVGVGNE